jgi:hypothetical protein
MVDSAPWTIKGMGKADREAIIRHARMADISVAEWMTRAAQNQMALEAGNRVIPPGKPEPPRQTSAIDLGDLPAALQAMAAAQAAGLPVSKAAVRGVVNLIREDVRAARGMPSRQTRPLIGQTIAHEAANGEAAGQ